MHSLELVEHISTPALKDKLVSSLTMAQRGHFAVAALDMIGVWEKLDEPQDTSSVPIVDVSPSLSDVLIPMREWSDARGNQKFEARLISIQDGDAIFWKSDNTTLAVPLDNLSDSDKRAALVQLNNIVETNE